VLGLASLLEVVVNVVKALVPSVGALRLQLDDVVAEAAPEPALAVATNSTSLELLLKVSFICQ
jgi:hypothetical protein